MKNRPFILYLLTPALLVLTGCGATVTPEPFFNHYMGQTRAYVMEHEGPPDTADIFDDGQGLTYEHKLYQNRDLGVTFATHEERVFTVSVTDNQPESAPPLEFDDWAAANVIGKDLSEMISIAGPPQTYIHIMPPPEAADHYPFFDRETEFMEYANVIIDGVPYFISYGLHNGRVESIGFFCRQTMPYAEFSQYALAQEQPLMALLDEPAWVRCLNEFKMEPEDIYRWHFTKRMVDERYLLWFGGRVYDNADSNFFVVFMYDINAANTDSAAQVADNLESFRATGQYPACEYGGDFNKLPPLPLAEEKP